MSFVTYTPTPVEPGDLSEADDQEPLAAATTNVSLEQIADWIAWLRERVSELYSDGTSNDTGASVGSGAIGDGTWTDVSMNLDIASLVSGQQLSVEFYTNLFVDDVALGEIAMVRLVVVEDFGGANTLRVLTGRIAVDGTAAEVMYPGVSLGAEHVCITSGPARIKAQGFVAAASGAGTAIFFYGSWRIKALKIG